MYGYHNRPKIILIIVRGHKSKIYEHWVKPYRIETFIRFLEIHNHSVDFGFTGQWVKINFVEPFLFNGRQLSFLLSVKYTNFVAHLRSSFKLQVSTRKLGVWVRKHEFWNHTELIELFQFRVNTRNSTLCRTTDGSLKKDFNAYGVSLQSGIRLSSPAQEKIISNTRRIRLWPITIGVDPIRRCTSLY